MKITFRHRQSAHCESGVTANLLSHYGEELSEAMAFGIGAGIFFAYLPFIKLNDLPLTTFRNITGGILKRTMKAMGCRLEAQTFRNPSQGMAALDEKLAQGTPVGLQTGAWWLPYFPEAYRFHFNMHNLVVYGKDGDRYIISDPVFSEPVLCLGSDLSKARFAKGALAPKGKMYYLVGTPKPERLPSAVKNGIKTACRAMLKTPLPIAGTRGMRFLANRLEKWPAKLGEDKAMLYLGQLIRMQEEIGTGGAGFRFIYAAFLQEAATVLSENRLAKLSGDLTDIGDHWREFAVRAARNCKGRAGTDDSYPAMAAIIRQCADREEALFKELSRIV
ncbi:MAG: BtrH N-terminal domain-containing protein [Proteobacteria bacterium]|nr:BtrH N-terminal domain-containing protein [Pseudomonadota bacterium]MBU1686383.1 BtrH N-terminal domain-containing protein [Pseudomonadota bacterium]